MTAITRAKPSATRLTGVDTLLYSPLEVRPVSLCSDASTWAPTLRPQIGGRRPIEWLASRQRRPKIGGSVLLAVLPGFEALAISLGETVLGTLEFPAPVLQCVGHFRRFEALM